MSGVKGFRKPPATNLAVAVFAGTQQLVIIKDAFRESRQVLSERSAQRARARTHTARDGRRMVSLRPSSRSDHSCVVNAAASDGESMVVLIERDLMSARDKWLDEAETPEETQQRLKSDFLCYCNHDGLFADFHSMRHLFITSLERAGVSPKMAQTLARHSDIRLTLGVYTHVELPDCSAAIELLPAPPTGNQRLPSSSKQKSVA